MTYAAKVIADSIADGVRLTTLEATMPRIVLAEFNTHRMFSRNSASSRAIPVEKRIQAVIDDPFVPESFGSNQKGMQAGSALEGREAADAREVWMHARVEAVRAARALAALGVHKQLANRLIEPFAWTTVVVTATEWENYFNLRISSLAQPEIRLVSEAMKAAMDTSKPRTLHVGEWHLPYIQDGESEGPLAMISAARCARVSYLTQDGRRDIEADLRLAESLATNRHMSPFEHVARVASPHVFDNPEFTGNFRFPWVQLRKTMAGEDVAPKEVAHV
jgi:thymidylate synthase ThyX